MKKCIPKHVIYMIKVMTFMVPLNFLSMSLSFASNGNSKVDNLRENNDFSHNSKTSKDYVDLTIKGIVTDEKGEPLPGASVTVEGTTSGTVTDIDGNYTLNVAEGAILIFSYIGFETMKMPVDNQSQINISLKLDMSSLEEVVVVGYGSQTASALTGSISTVKSGDIARTGATTIANSLVGKIQGITARAPDARPGSGANLSIRNMGNPLYVIDGIPQEDQRAFNQLGMNDIENISILKDASAAIYGLRAANGVILVTTKKGATGGKPTININSYYGQQTFTRFPEMANAYQYVRSIVEAEQNEGLPASFTPKDVELWKQNTEPGYQSFNFYDMVMRPSVPQSMVNANVSGGSDRINYFVSLGYVNQEALIRGHDFNRYNIQSNLTANITDKLKFGSQISGRLEDRFEVGLPGIDEYPNAFNAVFRMWPIERPYANDNPKYINNVNNVNVNPATYTYDITGFNSQINHSYRGNFFLEYGFDFGLVAKGTLSYGQELDRFENMEYTYQAYEYNKEMDEYITQPGWGNQNPWRRKARETIRDRFFQFQLSYDKQIGDHFISGVVAMEQQDRFRDFMRYNTVPTNNFIQITRTADFVNLLDQQNESARAGVIGRVNYNYKQKYLFEALSRYDGSFMYYQDKRWGLFPAVSLGWRISEEGFMKDISFINDLKIRTSYGQTGGEIGVTPFGYVDGYNFGAGSSVLDGRAIVGLQHRGIPIRNLSWVTNVTSNLGIDFAVINKTLTGSFDLFQRKREGLPAARYDVLLPSEVGVNLPNENLESDVTRGIEGGMTYANVVGKINYSIGLNATLARSKILEKYKPRFANSYDEYRNSPVNRWENTRWGYQVQGQFQSMNEINNHPINNDGRGNITHLPGDFIYKDVNGDGIINNLDLRPIGYGSGANNVNNPILSFGGTASINWRRISVVADFAGGSMQSIARNFYIQIPFAGNGNSPAYLFEDRWHRTDPFDPNSEWVAGTYPALRKGQASNHVNYQRENDFWVINVKYVRLRNLEIGYDFLPETIGKIGLTRLRVYANGSNLISLDNVQKFGIDPEIGRGDGRVYPSQRLFALGINLSL